MQVKGVSAKRSRNPDCMICKCSPCAQEEACRRARGQAAYDARKRPPSAPTSKESKSNKKKPALSKNKFISNLRSQNPSISDSEVKKRLKKAGYSSCPLIILAMVGVPAYGFYEIVSAVWG